LDHGELIFPKQKECYDDLYKSPPPGKLFDLGITPESKLVGTSLGHKKAMKLYDYEMK
jgi:hypothetical protein